MPRPARITSFRPVTTLAVAAVLAFASPPPLSPQNRPERPHVGLAEAPGNGRWAAAVDSAREIVHAQMDRLGIPGASVAVAYGIGWFVGTVEGHREVWHTGGAVGGSTILLIRPDDDVVVAILTNLESARPTGPAREIAGLFSAARP